MSRGHVGSKALLWRTVAAACSSEHDLSPGTLHPDLEGTASPEAKPLSCTLGVFNLLLPF